MNATAFGESVPGTETTGRAEHRAPVPPEERGRLTVDDRFDERLLIVAVRDVYRGHRCLSLWRMIDDRPVPVNADGCARSLEDRTQASMRFLTPTPSSQQGSSHD